MLRRIEVTTLEQLRQLLAEDNISVEPIAVQYGKYHVRNTAEQAKQPLRFRWQVNDQTQSLLFGLTTWSTRESQKFPDTYLTLGTEQTPRIVGFPLYWLLQDDESLYLAFKLGNNEGGKNRWFGRARGSEETRSEARTSQLITDLRQAFQLAFPGPLLKHPNLSGDWLNLAQLPLSALQPNATLPQQTDFKTQFLKQILQAFVIAEKLRSESFNPNQITQYSTSDSSSFMSVPRNQLLYGPPGTGKTYHTAVRALGILAGLTDEQVKETYERDEIHQELDRYRLTGQLEFVTFHQAFSYEDFVEGIKPVAAEQAHLEENPVDDENNSSLRYIIERGVFKILAERAAYALYLQQRQNTYTSSVKVNAVEPDFDTVFDTMIGNWRKRMEDRQKVSFANGDFFITNISNNGTSYFKYQNEDSANSYPVTRAGLRIIQDANLDIPFTPREEPEFIVNYGRNRTVYREVYKEFRALEYKLQTTEGEVDIVTPTDISELLQSVVTDHEKAAANSKKVDYSTLTPQQLDQAPRFVLIIDEINRGNVANIFGELITLLEKDKRGGQPEMLVAKLPYSKAPFVVPDNVYLLGTMNTADRSVEALDTALRRRFSFTEMRPDPAVIRKKVGTNGVIGEGENAVDVAKLLEVINSRLEQLLDHDHCLGHALLLGADSIEQLRNAFEQGIIPLLQEYFFADWGKIGLVLGDGFVKVIQPNAADRYKLASLSGYSSKGFGEKPLFRLTPPNSWQAATFRSIYE